MDKIYQYPFQKSNLKDLFRWRSWAIVLPSRKVCHSEDLPMKYPLSECIRMPYGRPDWPLTYHYFTQPLPILFVQNLWGQWQKRKNISWSNQMWIREYPCYQLLKWRLSSYMLQTLALCRFFKISIVHFFSKGKRPKVPSAKNRQ